MSGGAPYAFDEPVPLDDVPPGTTLLVAGSGTTGARELALHMVLAGSARNEGMVLTSTATRGERLREQCGQMRPDLERSRLRVVDATGRDRSGAESSDGITRVADPSKLSAIGMAISSLHEEFHDRGTDRVRNGVYSLTSLLEAKRFKTVFKFLHILAGRVRSYDGLGVLYLETSTLTDDVIETLSEVADARIDVREGDRRSRMRVTGLEDRQSEWRSFDVSKHWPRDVGGHAIGRQVTMGRDVETRYHCTRCNVSCRGTLDIDALRTSQCG